MPAQAQPHVDWWGNEEPPTAEEAEMVEELLEAHPLLTMCEALNGSPHLAYPGGSRLRAGSAPICDMTPTD